MAPEKSNYLCSPVHRHSFIPLGNIGAHSVLDAELAAILLAAHLILSVPNVDDATIFTDSQTAIMCLEGRTMGASQTLLKATKRMLKRAREKAGGTEVRLQWCPGHSDIRGNDLADSEAKAAAQGKTYPEELIPSSLVHYRPPRNPTTLKRTLKEENRQLARSYWETSEAGVKYHARYPTTPPFDFIGRTRALPRSRIVTLYRLISGHAQLNHHLHRLQAVPSPICDHCGDAVETVAHFLTRCTHFAPERYIYLESLGRDYLHLSFLLSSPKAISPLFDFIKATGRFSDSVR
jgi:ribonuclease HI